MSARLLRGGKTFRGHSEETRNHPAATSADITLCMIVMFLINFALSGSTLKVKLIRQRSRSRG